VHRRPYQANGAPAAPPRVVWWDGGTNRPCGRGRSPPPGVSHRRADSIL